MPGSILFVVLQLLRVADRAGRARLVGWGLLTGLFLGIATDLVLVAAGPEGGPIVAPALRGRRGQRPIHR